MAGFPADLQRQVKERIVRVALVAARGASDLTAQVATKNTVDKGRFVQARHGQSIAPTALVGIDSGFAQFPVVHGVQQVHEKFVGIFLSTRSKLVAVPTAAVSERWNRIDDIPRRDWSVVVEMMMTVVAFTSSGTVHLSKQRPQHERDSFPVVVALFALVVFLIVLHCHDGLTEWRTVS